MKTDVLILGAGLAGLSAALAAAPRRVVVASPVALGRGCSSAWAQGGVAAALGPGDSPAAHAADTAAAGAGLVEAEAVRELTEAAAETVERLAALGAPFDRDADGAFVLNREAAHAYARVARVAGDGAGRAIMDALIVAARAAGHVTVVEGARARALLQDASGRVRGAVLDGPDGRFEIRADATVLATGGVGGLYAVATPPPELKGEGLALAALAGAEIVDPEFVQFHPTALDVGLDPAPLATEALRGEGAVLIDGEGRRFMTEVHPDAELAPRDVVARAAFRQIEAGRGAFLDAREAVGARFPEAFPAVFAAALRAGIDPRVQPLPVAPAAHYHMGGIAAGTDGRTDVAGLYAVGECAWTGVHGANRLASNSLLEAAAFGARAGAAAAREQAAGDARIGAVEIAPDLPDTALQTLRQGMSRFAGVEREAAGLSALIALIDALETEHGRALPLIAARFVAEAALARRESRGGHWRRDWPQTDAVGVHTRLRLVDLTVPASRIAAE